MQLMIDIHAETPEALRSAGNFLLAQAMLAGKSTNVSCEPSSAPAAQVQPVIPPPPHIPSFPPIAEAIDGKGNAAPDVPSVPEPPAAPDAPSAPEMPATLVQATPPVSSYDSSGVPFDGRIHQSLANKKADGTWKIKKGIETKSPGLVEQVMKELAPLIRVPTGTQATLDAPPPPSTPVLPSYAADAPEAPPKLDAFRTLVRKISEARTQNRLTAEEINTAVASAGAPSLQLLNNTPHLIPQVELKIDALLATR